MMAESKVGAIHNSPAPKNIIPIAIINTNKWECDVSGIFVTSAKKIKLIEAKSNPNKILFTEENPGYFSSNLNHNGANNGLKAIMKIGSSDEKTCTGNL